MATRNRIFQIWTLLFAVSFSFTTVGQDTPDPFLSNRNTQGGNPSTNSTKEGWSETRTRIDHLDAITSGGLDCPVIVVGKTVYSTETLQPVSELEADYSENFLTALSGNGQYFAVASKSVRRDDTSVFVFDVKTGKKISEIPGAEDEILDNLQITRDKYVVTCGRAKPVISVWSAATGQLVKEFIVNEDTRLSSGHLTFTKDGQYMAVVQSKALNVFKVAESKVVARMEPPNFAGEPNRVSFTTDHISIYARIQDLNFSPAGTELAAFSTDSGNRIYAWDDKANLKHKVKFEKTQDSNLFLENSLQWLPDGKSWLVAGNLIDRELGIVLLAFKHTGTARVKFYVHDQNWIIARLSNKPTELTKVSIPWEDINRSRDAIVQKVPAYLAPYSKVDVRVKIDTIRGPADSAHQTIVDGLSKRLARDGIQVQNGASNYFVLRFSEEKGESLPIYERQSRFDRRGTDTGRTAIEARGALIVEFYGEGLANPLWRAALRAQSARNFREAINDASIRKSMLSHLKHELEIMKLPYFIPKDDKLLALPIIIE